ncbi:sterigmatocystin biosynthesis P450 monooxygenase stcL [Penicillium verhagenii]|nr:sterigmatocystin biosynthesis P450 monooxygenase stcL [Penicillium verhagenii]
MFSPLRSYPGPKLWAISKIPSALSILGGQSHIKMLDLHNKYGPVVRIGPTDLSFNTPQAFQDIYGYRPGKALFSKDPKLWASKLNALRDSIVGQVDHDAHARHRRLLSHAFSDRYLREQEGIVVSFVDLLISRLRERIGEDGLAKEDIKNWMNFVTFDITGDLMFAETFDCLKDSQLHPWISFLFTTIKGALFLSVMNRFTLFSRMNQLLLPEYLREQMMKNTSLSREKADRRLRKGTRRPDFMSALLKHGLSDEKSQFTENQSIMSLTEIHANFIRRITLAGSETSASLLSGCIFLLCKNATAMVDLRSEVRTAFSEDKDITSSQCARLNYLNAVIEESLRLYPPFVTSLLRIAPTGGEIVDGYFVPEHANVSTHHYASYHSPANFALPDEFIPERWLGVDERFKNDKRDVLQPFSLGPRSCIGKSLAYMEMRLVLAKLMYNFDIELCEESENWIDQDVYSLWHKPALMVELQDRLC